MNDVDAMVAFCHSEHRRLVGILTLQLGDRWIAEELAQEALIRACEHWSSVRAMDNPRAWVTRVACNLATSWVRRRVSERKAGRRLQAREVAASTVSDTADAIAVRDALAGLPSRQRKAVVLRYWGDLSAGETAAVMGIAEGTVRALCHQAVVRLREAFDVHLEEEPDHVA